MSNNTTVKNTRGHPREFEAIITEKSRNFVGREFVFSAINNFLQEYDRGYFTIIGEPGIGKSAILAKYVKENSGVVYYNVDPPQPPLKRGENVTSLKMGENVASSKRDDKENKSSGFSLNKRDGRGDTIGNHEIFFRIVCSQLREIIQGLGGKNIQDNFADKSTYFSLLLQNISDRLPPKKRLIIIIDSYDRIDLNQYTRGANPLYLPRYLPEKVYFILARRPFPLERSGLLIEAPAHYLDLADYSEQNQADIQEYIKNYDPSQPPLKRGEFKDETFLQRREFQDETNFMYVKEMLASQNLPNNTLPQKLQDYYQEHYEKMKSAVEKNQSISLDVLNLLIQDKQPISVEAIAERLEEDEYDIEIILDQWREFLHLETIENQVYYHFYHHNFCDWLRQKLNLKTT